MKLFSKRNRLIQEYSDSSRFSRYTLKKKELISSEIRNRVASEIKFLASSNDYLEWFILFENQKQDRIFLDKAQADNFSLAELGYSMSDYFEFENFKVIELEQEILSPSRHESQKEKYFDDFKLFDLAEMIILFSKNDKRQEVIKRFNLIFHEESADFQIVEHLITKKTGETLASLSSILKDEELKAKIGLYFQLRKSQDYKMAAKTSSEILNIIFSDYIKKKKTKKVEEIVEKLTSKTLATKDSKKIEQFKQYINDLLQIAKSLSNDIYDVRHTEKSTIRVSNDGMYKLISNDNIALAELVLTTLKDDFVIDDNWEKIKQDYIGKYQINPTIRRAIRKPKEEPVNLDDIPF
jgi:hypothetical protein